MRLRAAMSIPREKALEFKADALKELMRGILTVSRLNFPRIQQAFNDYLAFEGLAPNDNSVMAWLQENDGPFIGVFILEPKPNQITFRIITGTQAELRQIGDQDEESNRTQGAPSVGQVNLGERARVVKPGFVQTNQQG